MKRYRAILGLCMVWLMVGCGSASDPFDDSSSSLSRLSFIAWDGVENYESLLEKTPNYDAPIVYLNPVDSEQNLFVENSEVLQAKGSDVWYLMSGSQSLYPPNSYLQEQITLMENYNNTHSQPLLGMSLDIEVWTTFEEQNSSANQSAWQEYLDYLTQTKASLHEKGLKLSVMVPYWLHFIDEAFPNGYPLDQAIVDIADEVVVMAYSSDKERVFEEALPWLAYAKSVNKRVKVAIEMEPSSEEGISFYQTPEGVEPLVKTAIPYDSFGGYVIHTLDAFVQSGVVIRR